jgi:hypothetical protein
MKSISSLALLLISLNHSPDLQTPSPTTQLNVIAQNQSANLQLTTEVLEARFCASDYLRLKLRLRYFNSGSEPVILYRASSNIMTYFISRDAKAAVQEKYEQKYSPLQRRVGPPESIDSDSPDDQTFIVLKSGSSFDVTSHADFPFVFDGQNKGEDLLRPGSHVLQIRARTWVESPELAEKLRQRWRNQGYLWSQPLVSRPMLFTVAKNPRIAPCAQEIR